MRCAEADGIWRLYGQKCADFALFAFGGVFCGLGVYSCVFWMCLGVFGRVWALFAHLGALIELLGLRRGALSGSWGGF